MRIRGASKADKKIRDGSTRMYICTYACMYIHRILACRISHGNHSYCTNKMADGFRFRLAVRRGSCADLVSRFANGAEGDEEGQIVRIDYASGGLLFPRCLISKLKISTRRCTCMSRQKARSNARFWSNLMSLLARMTRIRFCRLPFMRRD